MIKKVKYWVSAFDNSEAHKKNPKAPKIRLIVQDPDTKEEWDGALFLKKAKSGLVYLNGEIEENEGINGEDAPIFKNMFNENISEDSDLNESDESSQESLDNQTKEDTDGPF